MAKRAAACAVLPAAMIGVALLFAGCAPALDWRESRPEGSGATMTFPCRPQRHERTVRIGDTEARMQLHSCAAADAVFSLSVVDASGPGEVSGLVAALRRQASVNISGAATARELPRVAGATPNPQSGLSVIVGRRPDGRPVVEHAAFFVKGLRVYQATVLGDGQHPGDEAVDTFFAAIRLP